MIWNETKECMSLDEKMTLQSARLVKQVDRVYHNVEYYRKKMQQAGYIERKRSEADDRVVLITLTEDGRVLQEKAKEIPGKVGGCISLSPEKAQTLYTLLYELLENREDGIQ